MSASVAPLARRPHRCPHRLRRSPSRGPGIDVRIGCRGLLVAARLAPRIVDTVSDLGRGTSRRTLDPDRYVVGPALRAVPPPS